MAAVIVGTVDQEPVNARRAHFCEGDLLAGDGGHVGIEARPWPAGNRPTGWGVERSPSYCRSTTDVPPERLSAFALRSHGAGEAWPQMRMYLVGEFEECLDRALEGDNGSYQRRSRDQPCRHVTLGGQVCDALC